MRDLIILGAGGLGQEVAMLAEELDWNILGFIDDYPEISEKEILGYPVLGDYSVAKDYENAYFVVAFGDPFIRRATIEKMPKGTKWATLISSLARIHKSSTVGEGTVIHDFCLITTNVSLGNHVYINVHSAIGHAVEVGDYSITLPFSLLSGGAIIGHTTMIGAQSFIRGDVVVGNEATVGANSCVVNNVEEFSVVVGSPARLLRKGRPQTKLTETRGNDA